MEKVLRMEGKIGALVECAYADLIAVEGNPMENLYLSTNQGAHMPLIMKEVQAVKPSSAL